MLIGYTQLKGPRAWCLFCDRGLYVRHPGDQSDHVGFGASLFAAIGMAAAASAMVGLLFLRAAGIYFLLITLAVAMCIWGLIYRWVSLTGGDNGIMDIPRPKLGLPWNLLDPVYFYYFVLVFFITCFVLIFTFWSGLPSGGRWWGSGTANRG